MLEVAESCCHHGDAVGVAVVHALLVADRSSGMNNGGHTRIAGDFHTVGEGKNASDAITAPLRSKPKE